MDNGIKLRNRNPKDETNFISKLFFLWIIKTYRKILNNDFTTFDLYKVLMTDNSEQLGDNLEKHWNNEVKKAKLKFKKPQLLKAVTQTFLWNYMGYGIILFIQHVGLRTFQPLGLAHIISLFGKTNPNYDSMYLAVASLVGVTFFIVFSNHHVNFGAAAIGMRIRIALSSLIYRKTLKLSKTSSDQTSIGQIVNLLSNDVTRFDLVVLTLHYLWILPFQVSLVTYLCWKQIGVSALVGVVSIALLALPFQGYLGTLTSRFRVKIAERTDHRVTLMSEIISGIQVIKMYAWEKPFQSFVKKARMQEMIPLTVTSHLRGIYLSFMIFLERIALLFSLTYYTLSGNVLLAEQVFSIAQFFSLLHLTMSIFYPMSISLGSEALVAINRIEKFLLTDEIEKSFIETDCEHSVVLDNVCASWTSNKTFLDDITFNIPQGSLCAIVGPVGAGKSTILQLLLNELIPKSGKIKMKGTVSFASQEPWLFGSTIRNNIIFGSKYDKKLYNTVVKVCALQKDFDQFPLGDKTLVGERGAVLSGGQRARVNLARAIYRQADIYLLDDPLSSVDVHVAKHLFEECIFKYLRRKTRILVTHRLQYLQKADFIIVLDNGKIECQGTYKELLNCSPYFSKEKDEPNQVSKNPSDLNTSNSLTSSDSFMLESRDCQSEIGEAEESGMKKGTHSLFEYIKASDSKCFVLFVCVMLILCQVLCTGADYWLTFWTQQETLRSKNITCTEKVEHDSSENSHEKFYHYIFMDEKNHTGNTSAVANETLICLYVYASLIVLIVIVTFVRSFSHFKLAMVISKKLHSKMFTNLLEAPMNFFNTNPAGRILNRFAKDMGSVDEILPKTLLEATQIILFLCGILVMVIFSNYYMIFVTLILGIFFLKVRTWFVTVTKNVKHMEGIMKSPMFSHLNSSLQGVTTIRAFNSEEVLRKEFDNYQDIHTSTWFLLITTTASFGLWIDLLCLVFIACTSFGFVVLNHYNQVNSSLVGLAISQSLMLTGMLQYGIRQSVEVVNQLTSVERILQYMDLEKETSLSSTPDELLVPTSWPQHGFILIEHLYLHYTPSKPPVLKNLNLEILAGQKIGIVGRTGAGKSSLIAALFRLTEFSGSIYIDGVDIKKITVQDLRKNLSIIPQEPVLFSTTIRQNLDPFGKYHDREIWSALEEVELKDVVTDLDATVNRSGMNFSIGQRQLICLARALLRKNKILIMDEATANIDDKTDVLIQKMIRKKFRSCTVLIVAHRLNTVMDSDKIIVLEDGEVVEYSHPYLLLQDPESVFHKMVSETGLETSARLEDIALDSFLHKETIDLQ